MFTKQIFTSTGDTVFALRVNKEESVGIITTTQGDNYFILDSGDYWYDAIQEKYPSELKCSCKNNLFNLFFTYHYRDNEDYPDIRQVDIVTKCLNCGKEKVQFGIDIDYSPTNHLLEKPITFCNIPKLKYDYTEINSFWTKNDVYSFIQFLYSLGLQNYAWFWEDKIRVYRKIELSEINENLLKHYLNFFFSCKDLSSISNEDTLGASVDSEIWRKEEIINLRSPSNIFYELHKGGHLYHIYYCNEYINDNEIKKKSPEFKKFTNVVKDWLRQHYVNKRGRNCFDNPDELKRLFNNNYEN